LLRDWLVQYKFNDWDETETNKTPVTHERKVEVAESIAQQLNKTDKWHSHSRGLCMEVVRHELKLIIEDLEENKPLHENVRGYNGLIVDYMRKMKQYGVLHTRERYLPLFGL